jgi:8-oxo-dGTP diphosphatase
MSAKAYGGVVIDEEGRVLLREPSKHYGGYVWTFPKGGADPGETPEEAAVREVREETGYEARIDRLLGDFAGTTSTTRFWLMRAPRRVQGPDKETAAVRWVPLSEARGLLEQSTTRTGRERDLAVLAAAVAALRAVAERA